MAAALLPIWESSKVSVEPVGLDGFFWNYEFASFCLFFVGALVFARFQSDWLALTVFSLAALAGALVVLELMRGEGNEFLPSFTGYLLVSMVTANAVLLFWGTSWSRQLVDALLTER